MRPYPPPSPSQPAFPQSSPVPLVPPCTSPQDAYEEIYGEVADPEDLGSTGQTAGGLFLKVCDTCAAGQPAGRIIVTGSCPNGAGHWQIVHHHGLPCLPRPAKLPGCERWDLACLLPLEA